MIHCTFHIRFTFITFHYHVFNVLCLFVSHLHLISPCQPCQINHQPCQVLFGSGNGIFYALSERLGTVNWEFDAKALIYTSAAVHRGGDHIIRSSDHPIIIHDNHDTTREKMNERSG